MHSDLWSDKIFDFLTKTTTKSNTFYTLFIWLRQIKVLIDV